MEKDLLRSGRLRDIKLPSILTHLQREKLSGTLTLKRNDQVKSIYVKEGDIIFASSQYSDDRFGEFLLKVGKISLGQYEKSAELVKKTGKRQGAVLVENGFLNPKDLIWGITQQVRDIILSLFTWIDGEYRFREGVLPSQEVITLKISTGTLILDGIKRISDWTRLRNELPSLDSVLKLTSDPMILFQRVQIDERERKVLQLIDGRRNIRQIFDRLGAPAFDTARFLYFLLSIEAVEITGEVSDPEPDEAPGGTSGSEADRKEPDEKIEGLDEGMSGETPKKKPIDRPIEQAPAQNPGTFTVEMLDPAGRSTPPTGGSKAEGPPSVDDLDISQEIFRPVEEEARANKQRISEAFESLRTQDHYQVLAVSAEATAAEVKKAYFRLAKEYHPDRHLSAGMEELREQLETLFQRITEAYDILIHEENRKKYDFELTAKKFGGRSVREMETGGPDNPMRVGQQAMRQGDYKAAAFYFESILQSAVNKGPCHGWLAQALSQIPGRMRDAEIHFKKAIGLDPAQMEHYFGLGLLYKKAGLRDRAIKQFEEVLKWDSENERARQEIREIKSSRKPLS